ncbi:MAG: excinuclease ABC subunit UvrC, partial [Candidatus Atribacteria bacterium]|nr:excinuclease ABC subunit UvrC [Candidatus Atribacteria bacterium]
IDGGAGQLSSAQKILQQEQCTVPVVALAKEFEEIYLPGKKKPLRLSADSESLQFLQRVRNEVHRFVITFHRTRRNKQLFHSLLEEIPGIGPRRRTILLSAFDDLHEILDQDANILGRKLQIPVRCIQAVQEKLSTEQKKVNGTKDGL